VFKLLSGTSDANFSFEDLRTLLLTLGFNERTTSGSHRIFTKNDVAEIINIQPKGAKAKPYQVKQIREIILKYKLADNEK
jgi:predicted RNA binding protein YcfA (HicA-like mRNA interferase family)